MMTHVDNQKQFQDKGERGGGEVGQYMIAEKRKQPATVSVENTKFKNNPAPIATNASSMHSTEPSNTTKTIKT